MDELKMDKGTLGLAIRLSRVLGVAPYSRKVENGVLKPLFVSGIIVVVLVSSYTMVSLMIKIIQENHDYRSSLRTLDVIRMISIFFLLITAIIGVTTSGKRIASMVRNLRKLNKIHEKISYVSVLGERKSHCFVLIYTLAVIAMHASDYFLKKSFRASKWALFNIFMVLLQNWVELCILQVVLFSGRVLETLTFINETLHQLSVERNYEEESEYMNRKTIKPKLAFVYAKHETAKFENLRTNINRRENTADTATRDVNQSVECTIRRLSKSYAIICEIIRDTTDVNGLLLIVALLVQALRIEMTTYQIVQWASYENNLNFEIIFLLYHEFSHVLGLFLLVNTFHQTHVEMERTQLLIQYLMCENANEVRLSLNNELDMFHHVLVLQKTTYSPLDMCTIDRSLFMKIFGILISYLVIIVTYGPRVETVVNARKNY